MSKYTSHSVHLSDNQKAKLNRAIKAGQPLAIKLSHAALHGEHPLPLTDTQLKAIAKHQAQGSGYTLNLSVPQIKHIVTGGFLPILLAGLASLATGALSGAAGYAVNRGLGEAFGRGYGEAHIQNSAVVGKGTRSKKKALGGMTTNLSAPIGQGFGFQGQGLFQYGQNPVRGSGMVPM